jgi:hypothetical protein
VAPAPSVAEACGGSDLCRSPAGQGKTDAGVGRIQSYVSVWSSVSALEACSARIQPPRLSGSRAPESDPVAATQVRLSATRGQHRPPATPLSLPTLLGCCYEAQSVCDPGCRRPKTKYETGTTPAELTTVTTVAHSHFGPRTWLAGRRLRSTSAAILRTPSATAALTSNLRVRSPRSLHCFLAAMTSLHTARIPMPCTLPVQRPAVPCARAIHLLPVRPR